MQFDGGGQLMATLIRTKARETKCPCCGTKINANALGRAGLTPELLEKIGKYIHERRLEEVFAFAESVKRQMDPSATSTELVIQESLEDGFEKMSKPLTLMSKAIAQLMGGTGKGEIAELLTVETLRQFFPQDEFDTTKASKGGTDTIAKVFDRKTEIGKIAISIKDTKVWKNDFKEQIEKNMTQESIKIGLLVSEALPKRANQTGELVLSNGVLYFLVHPKYATPLYTGLRLLVIHMHEREQFSANKEKEMMQVAKISKALAQWIAGDERKKFQEELDAIKENAEQTIESLQKIETYNVREFKKACDKQNRIIRQVLNQEGHVNDLKELLKGTDKEE